MRVLVSVGVSLLAACGGSSARPDGAATGDAANLDARLADALRDAAPPPAPRRLALAVKGTRAPLRVYAMNGGSFRTVLDLADPLGPGDGLTWADYDGDGRDDLVSVFDNQTHNGRELIVLHDDGPTGVSVVDEIPTDLTVLLGYDADGDGRDDLYSGVDGSYDKLYRSTGTAFTDVWTDTTNSTSWESSLASGDLTGDGHPDIVVAREEYGEALYGGGTAAPTVLWSRELPEFTDAVSADIFDADGDGRSDVAFTEISVMTGDLTIAAYHWDGTQMIPLWSTGQFGDMYSLSWGDIDGDGNADLAFCGAQLGIQVYGRVGGVFTPNAINTLHLPCQRIRFGDYDADGDADLAVSFIDPRSSYGVAIYENTGGTFTQVFHDGTRGESLAWGRCDPGTAECFSAAPDALTPRRERVYHGI
jgi:hypothetical protein